MEIRDLVLIDGVRTPMAAFNGPFTELSAIELGARAAKALANDENVTAVACFTTQGKTAWLMSKIRPRVPIMAFTPNHETYRRLAFMWGVRPQKINFANSLEEMLEHVDAALMRSDVVQPGDQVVLVCGFPVGALRPPNMALLYDVGER